MLDPTPAGPVCPKVILVASTNNTKTGTTTEKFEDFFIVFKNIALTVGPKRLKIKKKNHFFVINSLQFPKFIQILAEWSKIIYQQA